MTEFPELSAGTLARLGAAISRLGGDSEYIAESLTNHIDSLAPIKADTLTRAQAAWLVESGSFTEQELAEVIHGVKRGRGTTTVIEGFLSFVNESASLEDAASILGVTPDDARRAAQERTLYAFEMGGRLRFPLWQFDIRESDSRLRGLTDVIRIVGPDRHWLAVNGLMKTPQEFLIGYGRHTPYEWLRTGGDLDSFRDVVELGYYR